MICVERSCSYSLLRLGDATADHGAHAVSESGKNNHQYMNQQEHHQKSCHKEVDGARGLVATQNCDRTRGIRRPATSPDPSR